MNADQVKDILNKVYPSLLDYTVVFSGKKSNRVNGLYKPAAQKIIIHNRNFADDNLLMYTALHELAHHVCMAERGERGARAHTQLFWAVFHDLLDTAVEKGFYVRKKNEAMDKLVALAKSIDRQIAQLQRELGGILLEINKLCAESDTRYEDVVDSEIHLSRKTMRSAVKSAQMNVPRQYGQDVQNLMASARDGETRRAIERQAQNGKSIDQIKQRVKESNTTEESVVERLTSEKKRIEKTIQTLSIRLQQIIEEIKQSDEPFHELKAADRINNFALLNHKTEEIK